tara:strand:- start:48 stop:752 length:705 start_codon:yes stop_codon:yes gene_type:complete
MLGLGSSISNNTASIGGFELTSILGLVMWLKNDTGVVVSQWDDSSGTGNHVTQGTAGDQAALDQGGLNFGEGNNQKFYDFTTNIANSTFTYFFAVEIDTNNQSQSVFGSTVTSNDFIRLNQDPDHEFDIKRESGSGPRQRHSHSTDFTTDAHVFMVRSKAGDLTDFGVDDDIDADNQYNGSSGAVLTLNLLGTQNAGASNFVNGTILEVALYDRVLTDENVVLVREDIAARLGL